MNAYLAAHALAPRTKESYADLANRHLDDWINVPLSAISREMVEARHLAIPGRATANGVMRVLRALFNYAADRDPTLPPIRCG